MPKPPILSISYPQAQSVAPRPRKGFSPESTLNQSDNLSYPAQCFRRFGPNRSAQGKPLVPRPAKLRGNLMWREPRVVLALQAYGLKDL